MRKTVVVGAVAFVAVIAGMGYVINDSRRSAATDQPEVAKRTSAEALARQDITQRSAGSQSETRRQPTQVTSEAVPADPRLAALLVSPRSDLIEFVVGDDGQVIREIDQDPSSLGFKKPAREYTYSRGKVVGLTAYRYLGDYVEITRIAVSYKPDGSVDRYFESTSQDSNGKTVANR